MADNLNQKTIHVETDYDNIILIDPNKIVVDKKIKDRLVDHEELVFYANLETKVIPRTKLAIGESFDSPVINSSIASMVGKSDGSKINFLQPIDSDPKNANGTKRYFDTSWSDQLTGSGAREGKGFNQIRETKQNKDGKTIFTRDVTNYNDTQTLGIKDITVDISGINSTTVKINLVDVQGRTLFEQGEKSIYSVFFNLPYPLFYLTLKGYYGKAIKYALNLTKFNASFDQRTGNYDISLTLIGRNTGLLSDTLLTYAKTAPKMTPTTLQQQSTFSTSPGQQNSNIETIDSSIGEQTMYEVYKIYKSKGLIDKDFPEITIDQFIEDADTFVTKMQDEIKKGDFAVLSDVSKFRQILLDVKNKVFTLSKNKFLDLNNYIVYKGQIHYTFKNTVDYTKREEFISAIETEINDANKNLKANKSFGDNAEYTVAGNTYKESIVVKLDPKDVIEQISISTFTDIDLENTLAVRLGRTPTQDEVSKFKIQTLQDIEIFSKKIDDATGDLVDDTPTFFRFGETEFSSSNYLGNSFLDDIDIALKKLKAREEKIEQDFTDLLAKKITSQDGGLGFKPTIRNIFAILMAGVDTFYRLMDKTHTQAWNQRTNPKRLFSIIPPDKNFGIDSKNVINGATQELNDKNLVYPWPTYFTKERDPSDKSGREKYTLNYIADPKYIDSTNGYDYTVWPEVAFLEDYINAQTKRAQTNKRKAYNNSKQAAPFGSCNTLDFPFQVLPYENVSEVPFFYEIYERLYSLVNYTNLYRGNYKTNQVDKFLADLEAKNIIFGSESSLFLKEKLKNFKFNLQQLQGYLENIDKNTWEVSKRDLFVTDTVENAIKKDYGIFALSEIDGRSISLENSSPLIGDFDKYLKSTEHEVFNFLDTFIYDADLSDTKETFIFLDEKKTLARLNESETIKNITLLNAYKKNQFTNQNLKILTRDNTDKILDLTTLKKFYEAEETKFYVTENKLYYDNTIYSGNVSENQTTSFLNTPYFINSILDGVEKEKNNQTNPYVATGFLFINSLPIEDLRYPVIWDYDKNEIVGHFYETVRKFSAIHQVPYSFLLKIGAFWHRYKTYHTTGIDILDDCWKDFDYKKYYDPISNDLSKQYSIKDYKGDDTTFNAYRNEIYNNKSVDVFNYGFYPKLINDFQYFFTKKDLFNDYTEQGVKKLFDENKIKLGNNTNAFFIMSPSGDTNNVNRSILNYSYFEYLIFDKDPLVDSANKTYMLMPSCGGIPINQTNYECFTVDKKLNKEIKDNNSVYNGTVRSFWGCSQFGYFDNDAITKPDINQGLDYLSWFEEDKIVGIYSSFKKSILDDFEALFLDFCDPNPITNTNLLIQNENTVEKVRYSGLKQLKFVLKDLFTITESELTLTNQQNNDGELLGQKQVYNLTQKIKTFCNYDLILKIANSGEFDRKLFGSFVNNTSLKPLDPIQPTGTGYKKGSLPGDGSGVNLLQSKTLSTKNSEAWTALYLNVGTLFFNSSDNPGLNFSEYTDTGSTIFDFFIDNDIEFNKSNVEVYSKLIKIYSTQKNKKLLNNQTYSNTEFIGDLENFLLEKNRILDDTVVEVFRYLGANLPTVTVNNKNTKSTLDGNVTKLSLYNTFQAFNDKWIAGSDLTTRTIFEDFLFHDPANHDIGDELQVDVLAIKDILKNSDPSTDILLIIGSILKSAGDLLLFSMPAYINFYGINNPSKTPNPQNIDLPNSLFGTWTNVNYLDSRPKFVCVYVGKESERPNSKDNEFMLYADDSFDLRNPTTTPIRIESDKQNFSLSNKVVAFNVDFGIRNQNMFTNINVSMNDKKPTNATFLVNDQLANGVNGDKIAQQTTSLYSLYKSMSYACTVESMGNVMIQPLMYFNLRHVPLFYGPYYIYKVKHTIKEGQFTTSFDGSRMPKYALPQPNSLATFIKINYLENFKAEILKAGSSSVVEESSPTILDPERAAERENLVPNDNEQCQIKILERYKSLPEEPIRRGTMTFEDLKNLINDNVSFDRSIKTLIFTIVITRGINLVQNELIQVLNNNLTEVRATNDWPNRPEIKKWVCYNNGYEAVPYFSFDELKDSINLTKDWFRNVLPIISELNVLNSGILTDQEEIEQVTLSQAIIAYWDTILGFGPPPLTANEIKTVINTNLQNGRLPKSAFENYAYNVKRAQKYFPF